MEKDYFETLRSSVQEPAQADTTSTKSTRMASLTVKVDIDCKLYSDGDFLDLFEANKVKKIPIEVGQHLMTIESEHCDGVSEDHVIDAAEAGKNYLLLVNGLKQKEQDAIQEKNTKEIDMLLCKGKECYSNGDYESAFNMFKQAAEHGNAEAQDTLGEMYKWGRGVERDDAEALSWYRKAAEQGNADAQYNLGDAYRFEMFDLEQNDVEAVKWYHKAAEQGSIAGYLGLARIYRDKKNPEAVKWWRKVAELELEGVDVAQLQLGELYEYGICTEQNDVEAVKWYCKAAERGNSHAQYKLGYMYENGRGVESDDAEAVSWYRKAAEQGNADAQWNLGYMYAHGRGVESDDAEAVSWYRKAAEQGNARAQCFLGYMYGEGRGVLKDEAEALSWYRKAAEGGDFDARLLLSGKLDSV